MHRPMSPMPESRAVSFLKVMPGLVASMFVANAHQRSPLIG